MSIPSRLLVIVALAACAMGPGPDAVADPTSMRAAGQTSNAKQFELVEKPFFAGLARALGVNMTVSINPIDVVGVQAADALRLLRTGAFDLMSVQIGMASRDDPFFEGIDLVGVSTDLAQLRKAIDAYRDVFDRRLQQRFNSKVLTLWPFGPQVIYCNANIRTLDDLKGTKIRTFTPSMAALMKHLGATPVTLQFSEVYPALQTGVTTCAVTSPTSGNSGKWPEVTTHFLPLSLSGSVQGHFVNLEHWKRYSPETQKKLVDEFKKMEDQMWELAQRANTDAMNCNVGRDPCTEHPRFKMRLVEVSPADLERVRNAAAAVVLPLWRDTCNRVDPTCAQTWNETVGRVANLQIK